jgi:hypothetical protein
MVPCNWQCTCRNTITISILCEFLFWTCIMKLSEDPNLLQILIFSKPRAHFYLVKHFTEVNCCQSKQCIQHTVYFWYQYSQIVDWWNTFVLGGKSLIIHMLTVLLLFATCKCTKSQWEWQNIFTLGMCKSQIF